MSFEHETSQLSHEIRQLEDGSWQFIASFETTFADPAELWGRGDSEGGPRSELVRIFCYYLVSLTPEPGLKELAEEINEVRLFHTDNPPVLPHSRALQARTATLLAPRVRPHLLIEDED